MSMSSQAQEHITPMREEFKKELGDIGERAKKPMNITDANANDIAIIAWIGVLNGNSPGVALAIAYQLLYAINREE